MPAVESAIAFISRSGPTSSGVIAWRAGSISDIVLPCTTAAMIRCCTEICSEKISVAITSAFSAFANWPSCTISFFCGTRSAITPPTSERKICGIAVASVIAPSIE